MAVRQPYGSDDLAAEPRSVDLRNYWLVVRRRRAIVVLGVVIGILAAGAYSVKSSASYVATAQVVISAPSEGPLNQSAQPDKQINTSTEQAIAQSSAVALNAAHILGQPATKLLKGYTSRLTVTVPATADLLQIAWKASTAKAARAGANAFAEGYLEYRHALLEGQTQHAQKVLGRQIGNDQKSITHITQELSGLGPNSARRQNLESTLKQLQSDVNSASSQQTQMSAFDLSGGSVIPAALPESPSGLTRSLLLVIGLLLGLIIGLAAAFLREVFDDRIRDADQFERSLGAPVLAELPGTEAHDKAGGRKKTEIATQPGSLASDGLRALRATLLAAASRADRRTLLVVSADSSLPSGRMVADLGIALAESGRKVLLVATDFDNSTLSGIFDVPDGPGLADLLASGGSAPFFARKPKQAGSRPLPAVVSENLSVLPSGDLRQASSLLDSVYMAAFLRDRRDGFDLVLLEAPGIARTGDVVALASQVEGVLVLARAVQAEGRAVSSLRHRLDQVGARVIGGVLVVRQRARRGAAPAPAAARPASFQTVGQQRDEATWAAENPAKLNRPADSYSTAGPRSGSLTGRMPGDGRVAGDGRVPDDGWPRPSADAANRRP